MDFEFKISVVVMKSPDEYYVATIDKFPFIVVETAQQKAQRSK